MMLYLSKLFVDILHVIIPAPHNQKVQPSRSHKMQLNTAIAKKNCDCQSGVLKQTPPNCHSFDKISG